MAYALAGALAQKEPETVLVPYDPNPDRIALFVRDFPRVEPAASPADTASCSLTFLAVKPQVMAAALEPLAETRNLMVSIAAGLSLSWFRERLPQARVVRVMPNTPALAGEMAAAYAPGPGVTPEDLALVKGVLEAAGRAVLVSEELMDGVTGLSGSGPAFFARIAQAFMAAGQELGLSPEDARVLTLQTMKGTAVLLEKTGMSPDELVTMVSSPNGTTVAGREVLEASDMSRIIGDTVKRAAARSRELGK